MSRALAERSGLEAPLIVGVTGHRDLRAEDIPLLEKKVQEIFARFREQFPSTPLVVVSPLAEGADRLVARIGLEFNARLVVPLPMPVALYEADFEAPGSIEEFRGLLALADRVFELPHRSEEGSIVAPGPARDRRYELAGAHVVEQSQILIALWDGVESGKVGGTSAMVTLRAQGPREGRETTLEPPELFPVFHILTPRVSNPNPAGKPFRLHEIYPRVFRHEGRAKDYYTTAFGNLDRFNRQIGAHSESAQACKTALLGDVPVSRVPAGQVPALDQYAAADALAIRFHGANVTAHRILHVLVFAAFACFAVSAELEAADRAYGLLIALVLVITAFVVYRRARAKALDNQSEDYRAVAEAARVRFFWRCARVDESVGEDYLDSMRTELDWVRYVLRGWDVVSGPVETPAQEREALDFVLKRWVRPQQHYFSERGETNGQKAEQVEHLVLGAVAVPLVTVLFVVVAALLNQAYHFEWWETTERWLLVEIDVLLALGAIHHHYGERMAFSEHGKQYRRMDGIYKTAAAILKERLEADDLSGARECLGALGREALAENGEWVLLHRERPLELPHP